MEAIRTISQETLENPNFKLSIVCRQANMVAHVSQKSSFRDFASWPKKEFCANDFYSVPPCIAEVIFNEMT